MGVATRGAIQLASLPVPPEVYSAEDQRQTRRVIEQLLTQLSVRALAVTDPATRDWGTLTVDTAVDLTTADAHLITLGASPLTLTLSASVRTDRLTRRVFVTQDASGSRLVTWSGATPLSGTAPTLSTTAGAVDLLEFVWSQSAGTWLYWMIGRNMTVRDLLVAGALTVNGASSLQALSATTGLFSGILTPQALLDLSGAAAGQIKFPATQNASANANTLDDYEKGSWTPVDASGGSLTLTAPSGCYTKVGRLVIISGQAQYPVTVDANSARIGGFPFTTPSTEEPLQAFITYTTESTLAHAKPEASQTRASLYTTAGAAVLNSTLSTDYVYFTAIYYA